MRLTINLDDDLYAMARAHAFAKKMSISKAVGDLLRSRVKEPEVTTLREEPCSYISSVTGLLVNRGNGVITDADIQRSLDDEDLRYAELGGFVNPTQQNS